MPFKLKLKKTRQYNVASKSLFVISVELLDGGVADCTLSVDSTGQECLDNVCQRQAIAQPELFGLRYTSRSQEPRWVQLERPLKRQLDKNASSHQLYLRVMYYVVSGTSLITDEVTRYHYFLQLKNDLVEGRIICDCQQAVILASYSRQAEYGNHDRERHTVEYLKNVLTFPKQMIDGGQVIESSALAESGKLEWLTSAVIQHRMTLHNMSQAQAEEGFISACQQLRGYGQEEFSAHDQLKGSEVTIAVSLSGICVLPETSDAPHFYRWMDITNVINHKRTFSVECAAAGASASFALRTPELGKYVWRACVQQHTFYMRHQQAAGDARPVHHQTTFQEHGLSDSREELEPPRDAPAGLQPLTAQHRAHSTSCLELQQRSEPAHAPHRRALLPTYRPAPDYETAVQQKYQQQRAEAHLRYQTHHHGQLLAKPLVYGSHPDIHRVHYPDVTRHTVSQAAPGEDYAYGLKYVGGNYPAFALNPNVQTELNPQLHYVNVYKPPPPYPSNGLASNSTPDLAVASQALNYHRGYINSHVSGSSPDLVSTRTALNRQYLGYLNGNVNVLNYGRPVMASAHGTYNNLASVLDVPNPHIIMDPHHISDNIQKVYDERGNIMYSMPMHRIPYQGHVVLPPTQQIKLNETHEPIYENVPLPWQSDGKVTMRDRAQSLTTTDEIARLNERNSSHPAMNHYGQLNLSKPNLTVPNYPHAPPKDDSHYVNAQIIKGVRESSVPKDLNISSRSINKEPEFENIVLSVDRLSLSRDDKDYDETPYTSLSTHRVSNNNPVYEKSSDNVTSITVPDIRVNISTVSQSDSALTNSTMNSTYSASLDLESSANTTKSSSGQFTSNASGKEKKRRRWGMWMGRAAKGEAKSATLGRERDRAKAPAAPAAPRHRWSTGLPKFQPLPPSITKETLCQLLERKMADGQLAFAFEQLAKGREGAAAAAAAATALLPQHAPLNGYSHDHLPYEDNRVKLHPTPANRHGYVNASHITMTVGSSQRFYVVAKVPPAARPKLSAPAAPPAPEPAALLWEAAWLVGARVLALVGGAERPAYLPRVQATADYGKFRVTVESEARAAWGGSARVRVRCGDRARDLWHVAFTHWPDAAPVPADLELFRGFLSELSGLRLASAAEAAADRRALGALGARNAPLFLACSQGAGRSGVTLAADLLLHILDNNQELDIPRTVSQLHQQRASLIQNVHQYRFLHQILLQYLTQSRLI